MSIAETPQMCVDAGLNADEQFKAAEGAASLREDNLPDPVKKLDLIRGGVDAPLASVLLTGKKWETGRTITIGFLDGSAKLQQRVRESAEVWTKYANLAFQWIDQVHQADIRITFNRGGSWSYIGTDNLRITSGPTMQFGWVEEDSHPVVLARVVPHEFGHMIGLGHEQKSPSSNIPWDEQAVYSYYGGPPNNWTKAQVDNNVLGRYKGAETNYSEYDPSSIMHYPVDNRLTIGDFEIGLNSMLSPMDKAHAGRVYPFPDDPTDPTKGGGMKHLLVIQGKGPAVGYSVHVSGLAEFTEKASASIQPNDQIIELADGTSIATGMVGGGRDALVFDGRILSLSAGDERVTFAVHHNYGA